MTSKFLNSVPHRSIPLKVGQPLELTDLTVTIAQIGASEIDGAQITIEGRSEEQGHTPSRPILDHQSLLNADLYVLEDGTNYVGLAVKKDCRAEDAYKPSYYSEMVFATLQIAGQNNRTAAILNYPSIFRSTEELHLELVKLRGDNAELKHEKFQQRASAYMTVLLEGITTYIKAVNAGRVSSPINNIVVALDEAAYSIWEQNASEWKREYLNFDSPTKRRLLHERQLLKNIHLCLGDIDSWMPHLSGDILNFRLAVQKAVVAYLAHDKNVRRQVEDWPEFGDRSNDGNYASILESRAMRDWGDLMDLFSNLSLNAAKLLDYIQTTTDAHTASMLNNNLLFIATSDLG